MDALTIRQPDGDLLPWAVTDQISESADYRLAALPEPRTVGKTVVTEGSEVIGWAYGCHPTWG